MSATLAVLRRLVDDLETQGVLRPGDVLEVRAPRRLFLAALQEASREMAGPVSVGTGGASLTIHLGATVVIRPEDVA